MSALVAALVSHMLTSRREKQQWDRQVSLRDQTWERERQERQEQWNREDEARWHHDRLAAYSSLLGSVERWTTLARRVRPFPLVGRTTLTKGDQDRLEELVNEIYDAETKSELLAPETVMGKVRGLYMLTSFFTIDMSELNGRTPEELETRGNELIDKVTKLRRAVQDEIKKSLKIVIEDVETAEGKGKRTSG
ncbi:hypothetical protein [Micromonospora arborensis]|uniref:hypothetical protein n=1 Tax=Micromonospora arborensis TaxID=2116518 RepID=UPI0011B7CBA8|nr:hypothetical protein [Micromonospora arborensis]